MLRAKGNDSSEDETAARAYLVQKHNSANSRPSTKKPTTRRKKKVDSDEDSTTAEVKVGKTSSHWRARPSKKRKKAISDEDELSSDDEDAANAVVVAPPKKRGAPKARPKPTTTMTSAKKPTGPLAKVNKSELIKMVEKFRKTNSELEIKVKEESDRAAQLDEDVKTLSAGFTELQEVNQMLKTRLSKYEVVDSDEEDKREEGDDEDLGGMDEGQHDSAQQQPFDVDDDSDYYKASRPLEGDAQSSTGSGIPYSQRPAPLGLDPDLRRTPTPDSLHSQQKSTSFVELEDHEADVEAFDESYPELVIDNVRETRAERTHSWASVHPPSPAFSQGDEEPEAARRTEQKIEEEARPGSPPRRGLPTPDLSSSPAKNIDTHLTQDEDDFSDGGSTIVHDEQEEQYHHPESVAMDEDEAGDIEVEEMENDGAGEDKKIAELERELGEAKARMGRSETAKAQMRDEMDVIAR
jgi:hypothetical protein